MMISIPFILIKIRQHNNNFKDMIDYVWTPKSMISYNYFTKYKSSICMHLGI